MDVYSYLLSVCTFTSALTPSGEDEVTLQLLDVTSSHIQKESRPSLKLSPCQLKKREGERPWLIISLSLRRAAGNAVLTHDGFHTRASEQERGRGSVYTVCKRESGCMVGVGVMVGLSKREIFVGSKKSISPLSKDTHTNEVELQCVPVSLLILFPLPPPFHFTGPINAIPGCYL